MPSTSTAVEMRIQGTDQASALLDAATQKLARLQGASSKASHKLRDAALGAGKALLFTGPLAALRSLRRGLLATSATAAALAYATDRAAARFGTLSDQAAQAGATADEITRLSLALQEAGVRGASIDGLSTALARMAKTTGRTGLAGLRETLAEIAALPDEAARVVALSNTLGKALGPQFAAIVRKGPEALKQGLDDAVAAMPGVSNAVVAMGDDVADGMKTIRSSLATAWDSTLVSIAQSIAEHFGESSFRALGLKIGAYVSYYAKIAIANIGPLWEHLKFWAGNLPRLFVAGIQDIGDALENWIFGKLGWIGRRLKDLGDGVAMISGALGAAVESDWQGALDALTTLPETKEAGSRIGKILGEYAGPAFVSSTAEAEKELADALAKAAPGAKAVEELADGIADSFSDGEDAAESLCKAGAAAAKKTAEAWKGAGAVMAGSYEALKLAIKRTAASAASALAPASSSYSTSSAAGADASLLQVQRDGWAFLRSSLSSLGVV